MSVNELKPKNTPQPNAFTFCPSCGIETEGYDGNVEQSCPDCGVKFQAKKL
jgi:predicted RNA-binding Zn-ribbon protein involved in translation (DUF1610 family)